MTFAAVAPPVVVVRVVSSGPSWLALVLTLLGTFLAGTATALVIQLYVVPRAETRKRREDRWERDVRELSEILTTSLTDLANDAHGAQLVFRTVRDDKTDEYEPGAVVQHAREAEQATWAYGSLLSTRVGLLINRIISVNPQAPQLEQLRVAETELQLRAIHVRVLSDADMRTGDEFDQTWEKEQDARRVLIKEVGLLERLPRPPH